MHQIAPIKIPSIVASMILMAGIAGSLNASDRSRPNVLVYIVDDWGWQDTSVPFWSQKTRWNDFFQTPNLEKLASTGMKFTQAYACSVCSPSRTSIMTGQNAARHKVTNWTLQKNGETSHKTQKLSAPTHWERNGLQPGQSNIAQVLQDRGYLTIHAGKAHWGAFDTPGSEPENLGFTINIGGHAAGGPGHYHGEKNYGNKPKGGYTKPWGIPGLEKYHGSKTHLTDATTIEAIKAMKKAVQNEMPFYLYLAHYAVHAPIMPHRKHAIHYEGKNYPESTIPITKRESDYASMVEGIDASLGEVLKAIEELGQSEKTIVIVLSDNGGLTLHARGQSPYKTGANSHCWPLREGKGSAYEGGTRIPLIVSWAKTGKGSNAYRDKIVKIPKNSVCNIPVIIEDIPMTILDLVTKEDPKKLLPNADGVSLVSLLNDPEFHIPNYTRPLVFHYPHQWTGRPSGGYQSHSSIRKGDWKAIYFYETQSWELYNLKNDISEAENLASSRPETLRKLALNLSSILDMRGAVFPRNHLRDSEEKISLP